MLTPCLRRSAPDFNVTWSGVKGYYRCTGCEASCAFQWNTPIVNAVAATIGSHRPIAEQIHRLQWDIIHYTLCANKRNRETTHLSLVDHSLYAVCAHHMHSTSKRGKMLGTSFTRRVCVFVVSEHHLFCSLLCVFLGKCQFFPKVRFLSLLFCQCRYCCCSSPRCSDKLSEFCMHFFAHCSPFLHYLYRARTTALEKVTDERAKEGKRTNKKISKGMEQER